MIQNIFILSFDKWFLNIILCWFVNIYWHRSLEVGIALSYINVAVVVKWRLSVDSSRRYSKLC